jgi:radical SAM protein with 4Fe4S-binding SPASM domain
MKGTRFDFFVQWHVTEKCNLACTHCYQSGSRPEMSLSQIKSAIDNVKDAVKSWVQEYQMEIVPGFHFTGGEPLLRRNLFDILDYSRNSGFSLALMTNGTLITLEKASLIKQAGVAEVQVSLEGTKSTHDAVRGKGSFSKAIRGINQLLNAGVYTHINVTLSRLNMLEVDGLVRLAEANAVPALSFSRLVPCGRGAELVSQMLTSQELAAFYANLKHYSDSAVKVSSLDPLAGLTQFERDLPEMDFPVAGCAAGVFGITIAADGSIMPCRRMDLSIGNIKEVSFRELWAESPVLWALRQRESYHGNCAACRYWAVCRGCRAVALANARREGKEDYLGADPQCPYFTPG